MASISLSGYVTQDGKLEVDLPADFPPGEVKVVIQGAESTGPGSKFGELLSGQSCTGAEVAARLRERNKWWDYDDLADSTAWVEAVRRREEDRRRVTW